jgi:hypothetical protein
MRLRPKVKLDLCNRQPRSHPLFRPNDMELADLHFELNPELLDSIIVNLKRAKGRRERRKSARQEFPVQQMMAPFYRKMPKAHEFAPVSCHDLSTSGVSFFWPEPPDFTKAILGLGEQPSLTYVAVRIVRHTECGPNGRMLIGCEFVDRVGIS